MTESETEEISVAGTIRYLNYRALPATLFLFVWGLLMAVMETIGVGIAPGWAGVGAGLVMGALVMDALLDGGHVSYV